MISVFELCKRNDTALWLKFVLKGVINKYLGFYPKSGRRIEQEFFYFISLEKQILTNDYFHV